MGNILDGVSPHMSDYPDDRRFLPSKKKPVDVARELKRSGAEIAVCYLPVGSEKAARFYAEACLEAGVALVNCMPVFIACDPAWAARFKDAGIPFVGDDVKAQVGATIVHRTLARLFDERGVKLDRTYQLNTGGNTDFLNMLNHDRLKSKRISKTEAVQSQLDVPLPRRKHPHRPERLRALAEGQQGLLPADRGAGLRRRADEPGAAPVAWRTRPTAPA